LLSLAAFAADPSFDYIGNGRGDAEIRAKCKAAADRKLSCHLTEVWASPMQSHEEDSVLRQSFNRLDIKKRIKKSNKGMEILDFERFSREELIQIWKEDFTARVKDGTADLAALKAEECRRDPRDYYEFRAAYNETFDAFNERAKEIQAKLCRADGANRFTDAMLERWELVRSTCELSYGTYEMSFNKQDAVWVHEGGTKGSHPDLRCYLRMHTELSCPEGKGCRLTRTYQPDPTEWNRRFGIGRCQGEPAALEIEFSPDRGRSRPKACKYLLDRLRASECCAFSQ